MNIRIQSVVIGLFVAGLVSTIFFGVVNAQSTQEGDQQSARIRASCLSAKNTLDRLHASDALLRVNRGQIYESMSTKLMTRFNSRVDSNRLDAKALIGVTENYGTALATFRSDYQSYEEQLSLALRIDCTKEPMTFFDAVADARTKRTQVHVDVVKLHQYIDEYRSTFESFVSDYKATTQENAQ